MTSKATALIIRDLGERDYEPVWRAMQAFTAERSAETADELWLLSHPPVYTQGQAGKPEHLLNTEMIPVVQIDRGGQVTYHGPGQLVIYLLIDIRRAGLGVRDLVTLMENSIIATLGRLGVSAGLKNQAPGVYVNQSKIASLGLRIRRGCSYHGLALNLDMDLAPFAGINPCGYQGMAVTRLSDLLADGFSGDAVKSDLVHELVSGLPGEREVRWLNEASEYMKSSGNTVE